MANEEEKSGLTLPHKEDPLSNVIHYTHFIRQEPGKLDALFKNIVRRVENLFSPKGSHTEEQDEPEGKP